tara:strand:+ start:19 stop:942 length:924 start_codon:yes stop_codon:yes gene_type:complete
MNNKLINHKSNLYSLDPKKTIQNNINRKKPILDRDPQFYKNVPLPSWIELSLIDVCNRICSFCPKSDFDIAPNTYQKMNLKFINKLYEELKEIGFQGAFSICGYGEPLLHKDLVQFVNIIGELGGVEIVTNGDPLKPSLLKKIFESKATKLIVSMYDGEHQIDYFEKMINETGIDKDFVVLRNRWHNADEDFGVKLTNRVGNIKIGEQKKIDVNRGCYYSSYQLLIDWNGNVYLCPQDWDRRLPVGNVMQDHFFEVWSGKIMNKYRIKHLTEKRDISPCNKCNADGKIHGHKHAKVWHNKLKIFNKI